MYLFRMSLRNVSTCYKILFTTVGYTVPPSFTALLRNTPAYSARDRGYSSEVPSQTPSLRCHVAERPFSLICLALFYVACSLWKNFTVYEVRTGPYMLPLVMTLPAESHFTTYSQQKSGSLPPLCKCLPHMHAAPSDLRS